VEKGIHVEKNKLGGRDDVKIQFCGAAGTVTGSCFLVTTGDEKFLVDCGMFQGPKELQQLNYDDFIFDPKEIKFVLLTHAHIDHSGLIPKLFKHGFRGTIYSTKATKELCAVVLPDSGHIQEVEVERKNRKCSRQGLPLLEPIYTVKDAQECQKLFEGYPYEEEVTISPNVKAKFWDAGHMLGSAIIEVFVTENGQEKKLVFSGDIGNIGSPLLEDPTKIPETNYVIMESTYGNRCHLDYEDRLETLARVVNDTLQRGGNLIIPSFAVERTQDMLCYLRQLKNEGAIPRVDIYVDSPMAVEATKVFIDNPDSFDKEIDCLHKGESPEVIFEDPDIHYTLTVEESMALNKIKSGAIIISASGMANAGRVKHHLRHNLWRPECTVLFVGFQAEGTLGRLILEGAEKVRIHGEQVVVKAAIEKIEGFSSHADQTALVNWLGHFEKVPDRVFLVHGEEESLKTLQRVISTELGIEAQIPEYSQICDLVEDICQKPLEFRIPRKPVSDLVTAEAFQTIRNQIHLLSKDPCSDTRSLERLLAQINEVERELSKAV